MLIAALRLSFARMPYDAIAVACLTSKLSLALAQGRVKSSERRGVAPGMVSENRQAKPGASANECSAIRRAVPSRPRVAVSVTQNHFASCLLSTYVGLGSARTKGQPEKTKDARAAPPALRERPAGPLAPDVSFSTVRERRWKGEKRRGEGRSFVTGLGRVLWERQ